ncbi:hypothetical protein BSL78_28808 [Apostichopus japonicus]|uniref:Carbohydrate sulfotransferase n=1 Tax=Stichopus japonicus TaxID=307972 RepID=A0A2G8JF90_STIJA|nr:hypothetical protein BSL78_28808 [Apostichopus japonicus]
MLLMESIFTSGIILFLLYKDVSVVRNSSPATFCSRKVDGNGYSVSTRIIASEVTQSDKNVHEYSKQNEDVDYMSDCPTGWFLSVSNQTTVGNPPSQRCQNDNDVNDWICAPGWVKLQHDPFCQREEQLAELRRNFAPVGPDFSQVSEKFKLLFIHIPQAGGLLIERSFLFDDKRELLNGHYLGGHYSINDFDSELVKSYHKFCVVRHPCSRLFSVWKYLSQRQGNENDDQWVDEHFDETTSFSFNAFIKKTLQPEGDVDVETETHLKSQINLLFDDQVISDSIKC